MALYVGQNSRMANSDMKIPNQALILPNHDLKLPNSYLKMPNSYLLFSPLQIVVSWLQKVSLNHFLSFSALQNTIPHLDFRQGNMHNHLANCVKATKI